jgi:tetratricopeptide (TPR) repeat protein
MKFLSASWAGDRSQLLIAFCWAVVMLLAVVAYLPALPGPFLLDDFGSVRPLGDQGGVVDWHSFKAFVFGGNAGPTGRPLSLLSFLIDANNWPADSWPFKRTNLVIHLVTAAVLGVLVAAILKTLEFDRLDIRWIALVTAALWLLHPFLVSTTMYIVQRMAQLATLFMFSGLAAYLHGRSFLASNPRKAYVIMTLAIGFFGVLAILSKENGILLPLLVGVFEITVIASQRHRLPALNRYWAAAFITIPSSIVGLYLIRASMLGGFFGVLSPRDFSIYERLLTQGRVLADYLQHWFLPKLYTTGVFQDHVLKSTGLLDPATTLLGYLLHTALIVCAFLKRRQWPLFSLAVLFFYGSHLLESTVVNLELYFEHRNYAAVAFLFLPFVSWLRRNATVRVFGLVSIAVLTLMFSFTRYSATVWESLPSMIESSALKAPTSPRAQSQWAKLLLVAGRSDEALQVIERAIENIPGDRPVLLTNRLFFLCHRDELELAEFEAGAAKLSAMPFDSRAMKAYRGFLDEVVFGNCPNITAVHLERMFEDMLMAPRNSDPVTLESSHVTFMLGLARVYAGKPEAALSAFQDSLSSRPGASHAMAMAATMASNGFPHGALVLADAALEYLQQGAADNRRRSQQILESDVLAFQETIRADINAERPGSGTAGPVD